MKLLNKQKLNTQPKVRNVEYRFEISKNLNSFRTEYYAERLKAECRVLEAELIFPFYKKS